MRRPAVAGAGGERAPVSRLTWCPDRLAANLRGASRQLRAAVTQSGPGLRRRLSLELGAGQRPGHVTQTPCWGDDCGDRLA